MVVVFFPLRRRRFITSSTVLVELGDGARTSGWDSALPCREEPPRQTPINRFLVSYWTLAAFFLVPRICVEFESYSRREPDQRQKSRPSGALELQRTRAIAYDRTRRSSSTALSGFLCSHSFLIVERQPGAT